MVATSPVADRVASRFPLHLVSLGVVLYGTGPVLARSSDTTGLLLSFWRLWFGFGVLAVGLAVHLLSGRPLGTARGIRWAMAAGAAFSLNQVLFFDAVKRTSVVDATLVSTLSPIVVAVLAVPLFGERPGRNFRLWSLVAMAGAVFVVLGSSSGPQGDLVGMLMAVGSTIFFAVFFVVSKFSRDDVPVITFLTTVMGTAAVFVSGYVLVAGSSPGSVGSDDLWTAFAMATIPGTLGHIAMTWPLRHIAANIPPLMRLAGPVVAGVFAWVFLGEGVRWVHFAGGLVILGGLVGALRSQAGRDLAAQARR